MPDSNSRDGCFYLPLTFMIDTYNLWPLVCVLSVVFCQLRLDVIGGQQSMIVAVPSYILVCKLP